MKFAAGGVRWTGLSSAAVVLSDLIKTVVLARYLSPKQYGLMGLASIVLGFAQMYADLGIGAAIIHKQQSSRQQLSSLYWTNIAFGILIFFLVCAAAPFASFAFKEPQLVNLISAIAAVFLIAPWASQFEVLLQRDLGFSDLARCEIAGSCAGTVTAIASAVAGFGVWTLVSALFVNSLTKTILLVRIGYAEFRPEMHFARKDVAGYIGFGLYQMGERSINYIAEKADQLIVGRLLGAEMLGYYNFGLYLTTQPVSRINPILTKVAFPLFSRMQHDQEELKSGYLRVLRILTTINAPLLLGLAAVAPWAIPLIFGQKWAASVPVVQVLSLVGLFRSAGNPVGSLQLAKGRADLGFWWNLVLFACCLPAIWIGARLGGATGVAVSLLLAQVALFLPAYLCLIRPLLGACGFDYAMAIFKPVALAAVMSLLVVTIPQMWEFGWAPGALALQIACGVAAYALLIRFLNPAAIADMRSALISPAERV